MAEDLHREDREGVKTRGLESPHNDRAHEANLGGESGEPIMLYGSALLSDLARGGRGNAPVRSALIQSMQQTHGNRATQRMVQRAGKAPDARPTAEKQDRGAAQREAVEAPGDQDEKRPEVEETVQREQATDVQASALSVGPGALAINNLQRQAETLAALQLRNIPYAVVQRQNPDGGTAVAEPPVRDAGVPSAGVPTDASAGPDAIPDDLRQFRQRGPYPADANGQTLAPSTGLGGFNARYDPTGMTLSITVNIGMTFTDGMRLDGARVVANDPSLNRAAARLNRLPRERRLEAVRDWQWTGQQAGWMDTYRSAVQSAWSSSGTGIVFQSTKPNWHSQLANVNVVVNTSDAAATAPGGAAAPAHTPTHTQATIFRTPDNDTSFGAEVGAGDAASGTDQTLRLGSGQAVTQQRLLRMGVLFGNNSSRLTDAAKARLRRFIISFQPAAGGAGSTMTITGRASATGGGAPEGDRRNRERSQERADAVANFLRTEVVEGKTLANATTRITTVEGVGSDRAGEEAIWRRVEVMLQGDQGQLVAAHEFGHMIGLGDEYASTPQRDAAGNIVTDAEGNARSRGMITGTGGDVGDPTQHNTLSQNMGLGGSVAENNDNIMSLGNTIRPQHYSTFMEALRTVTSLSEWGLRR